MTGQKQDRSSGLQGLSASSLYEILLDYAASPDPVVEVVIGPVWTLCQTGAGIGLAISPQVPVRTLNWPGTLCGRPVRELAEWLLQWEPFAATVAMAATNAALAELAQAPIAIDIEPGTRLPPNLAVFEHFLPQVTGRNVVVVGRYPGVESLAGYCRLHVLERQVQGEDYPDPAAEFLLPEADWVFITATSITNKTFPRLADLARHAKTVLMGPTLPWLPELADHGIDYLAGIKVLDAPRLRRVVAEGGGVRIFDHAVGYQLVELTLQNQIDWLRHRIARVFAQKEQLTWQMEHWYERNLTRFPGYAHLDSANRRLSRLDTAFKQRVP